MGILGRSVQITDQTSHRLQPMDQLNIREEKGTLAQFYPDAELRQMLHYAFVFRYLTDSIRHTGFFCERDEEWDRKIQARFITFEGMALRGPGALMEDLLGPDPVFRRVQDLRSLAIVVEDRPGVLIQMPLPERPPCAYFALALLDAPAGEFRVVLDRLWESLKSAEQMPGRWTPTEDLLKDFRGTASALFTLEKLGGGRDDSAGVLCCVRCDGSRGNTGRLVEANANSFVREVQEIIRGGGFPQPIQRWQPGATGPIPASETHQPQETAPGKEENPPVSQPRPAGGRWAALKQWFFSKGA